MVLLNSLQLGSFKLDRLKLKRTQRVLHRNLFSRTASTVTRYRLPLHLIQSFFSFFIQTVAIQSDQLTPPLCCSTTSGQAVIQKLI